jgi:hypothetical protein
MYYQQKGFRRVFAGLQPAAVRATAIALATVATLLLIPMSFAQQTSTSAAASVSAQAATNTVPNLIRYGGTLKGEQGAAGSLSATVGVTFAIYKQQDGGAPIWMETQNVTPEASGQYSVLLGSTKTEGVAAELFSDQEQRWLGVEVQGQPEQARVLLVSVPYAFRAHEAETLGGLPASAFAQVSTPQSSLGPIGSPAPLNASASPAIAASVSPAVTGSGAAGRIPLWTTTVNLGNSVLFEALTPPARAGFIGVKTTSPSTQLDVSGAINTSPTTVAGSNTGNYQILENPVLSIGWPAPVSAANNDLFVGFQAGAQGFAGSPVPSGTGDTFVGSNAGFHNLSGSNNTAVGSVTGYRNETGNNNVSVGTDAGFGVFGVSYSNNTVVGESAGLNNTASNVAFFGYQAGENNTGGGNSFVGYQSGLTNTTGINDTFLGSQSGYSNTTGAANSFLGQGAGQNNTTGSGNTFTGQGAGQNNTTIGTLAGSDNTFDGNDAGNSNTTGSLNAFTGAAAGGANTTGMYNTFDGGFAGLDNLDGQQNAFFGFQSGISMSHGNNNTCLGAYACDNGAQGGSTYNGNIMVGYDAGGNNITSSNDIYIGNLGCTAPCQENGVIRIGTDGPQSNTYIAGILNNSTPIFPNQSVCIAYDTPNSGDKLFSVNGACGASSRRFKENILDMGDSSSRLLQLRPVTFFYKPQYDDGSHVLQYGLIAEEVAQIYPEMVGYDKDGQPSSVKYQELAPMLLNELQKQNSQIAAQKEQIQAQEQQFGAKVRSLEDRLARMEAAFEQKSVGAPSR